MSVLRDYATAVSQPTLPLSATDEPVRYDEVVDAMRMSALDELKGDAS